MTCYFNINNISEHDLMNHMKLSVHSVTIPVEVLSLKISQEISVECAGNFRPQQPEIW